MSNVMISGRGIYKSYEDLVVLKGIDVEINQAEVISIVGSSGAGKSTLLHILGTLDTADKGEITIADENISRLTQKQLARFRNRNIGFIFQFHHLLPEFTALENICIPAYIQKVDRDTARKKAMKLLEYLHLTDRATHKPNEMSGGEQQRVAVARALINEPKVVLADEPSGNLDSANAYELHKLFFRLRDELDQTFVIATHNEQLAQMSDRRFRIKDGSILHE